MNYIKNAITYDRNIKLGGLFDDQAVFLNMTRFFDDFKIVSNNDGEWLELLGFKDISVNLEIGEGHEIAGAKLATTKEFEKMARNDKGRRYVLYSPLDPPYIVNPLSYIMNSPTIAHAYENKRYFRDEFTDLINLPEHEIVRLDEITNETYEEMHLAFGKMVLQDVDLSGSKGTIFANTKEEFYEAVEALKAVSYSGTIVISKFITGLSRSVQVCVTKYGIFMGGLQKQLVNSKYLCDPKQKGSTKWCGGEVGGIESDIVIHRTREIATIVGSELASHGYRGIFGIDLIVTPENDVYAIEVNARLTGYSHILSDMQFQKEKIPFMLLHALELGNIPYDIEDLDALPMPNSLTDIYSYLIINNDHDNDYILPKDLKSGIYKITDNTMTYVCSSYSVADLESDDEIIILSKFSKAGEAIEQGKRIYKIITKGATMDDLTGDLNERGSRLVDCTRNYFQIYQKDKK